MVYNSLDISVHSLDISHLTIDCIKGAVECGQINQL